MGLGMGMIFRERERMGTSLFPKIPEFGIGLRNGAIQLAVTSI